MRGAPESVLAADHPGFRKAPALAALLGSKEDPAFKQVRWPSCNLPSPLPTPSAPPMTTNGCSSPRACGAQEAIKHSEAASKPVL